MISIPELMNMPDKTIVVAVQGKVVAVYERKAGMGKDGKSTIQNCELQDSSGNKIKVGCWDHPDLAPLKGGEYVLHSTTGRRGMGGVSIYHNTYKDKVTVQLSVSKQGQFQHLEVYAGGATGSGEASNIPTKALSSPSGATYTPDHTKVAAPDPNDRLARLGNLWVSCLNEAKSISKSAGGFGPELFQALVSSLFIQACRDNIQFSARPKVDGAADKVETPF